MSVILMSLFLVVDTRLGICYESFDKESCKERFPGNQTKSDCCCSVLGKAWGTPCEVCPFKNSRKTSY